MSEHSLHMSEERQSRSAQAAQSRSVATETYRLAKRAGRLGKIRSVLICKPWQLLNLNELGRGVQVRGSHYLGLQQVSVQKIRGTEGRAKDFDGQFRPL